MWAMSQTCVDKIMSVQKISKTGRKVINLAHITSVSFASNGDMWKNHGNKKLFIEVSQ